MNFEILKKTKNESAAGQMAQAASRSLPSFLPMTRGSHHSNSQALKTSHLTYVRDLLSLYSLRVDPTQIHVSHLPSVLLSLAGFGPAPPHGAIRLAPCLPALSHPASARAWSISSCRVRLFDPSPSHEDSNGQRTQCLHQWQANRRRPFSSPSPTPPLLSSLYKYLALASWSQFPATLPLSPCPCSLAERSHRRRCCSPTPGRPGRLSTLVTAPTSSSVAPLCPTSFSAAIAEARTTNVLHCSPARSFTLQQGRSPLPVRSRCSKVEEGRLVFRSLISC
jgi:hypothetical protein